MLRANTHRAQNCDKADNFEERFFYVVGDLSSQLIELDDGSVLECGVSDSVSIRLHYLALACISLHQLASGESGRE